MSVVPVGKAYMLTAKTGDLIQIGNSKDIDFTPEVKLEKWNAEVFLKISFDAAAIAQKTVELSADNKVKWQTPAFDFYFYGIDEDDGGLEFEIILKQKPPTNRFSFQVQTQSLDFFYQPPLTEEYDPADCEELSETYARLKSGRETMRPEDVVGSYAVYHKSKRGREYKTGKAFHLYRPKLTDAVGKTCWGEYNRDLDGTGVLTITFPQDFLDDAVYPVVVDPTFGYTSIGGSNDYDAANYIIGGKFTVAEAGTLTKITFYTKAYSGTRNFKCAIYSDNAGIVNALLAESGAVAVGDTAGWVDFNVNYEFAAGTYWLCDISEYYRYHYYDSGGNSFYASGVTYPTFPDPVDSPNAGTNQISIYATYTTGATLQTVTDALSLGDSVLRNKTLILYDSLELADSLYGNKSLLLGDSASLSELITVIIGEAIKYVTDSVNIADMALTPSRVLQALDAIGLADSFVVNKVLQITETFSLAEIVEVGVGGVKKTRLFLILGDLAVQLTGD